MAPPPREPCTEDGGREGQELGGGGGFRVVAVGVFAWPPLSPGGDSFS